MNDSVVSYPESSRSKLPVNYEKRNIHYFTMYTIIQCHELLPIREIMKIIHCTCNSLQRFFRYFKSQCMQDSSKFDNFNGSYIIKENLHYNYTNTCICLIVYKLILIQAYKILLKTSLPSTVSIKCIKH